MHDVPGALSPKESPAEEHSAAEPATAATQAQTGPIVPGGIEEQLRKAELAAREHHDAWLRAKADADNIRKRSQVEIAGAHKFALENFAAELLAVKDSLEAALAADNATVDSMKSGVGLTLKQLAAAFDKFHLSEVNPLGQKFDPHRHQAISTLASGAEPNTVIQVLQKGYLLHDRVLRPALVVVAKSVEK